MSGLEKQPEGIVCIINNFCHGQDGEERHGSEKDVAALVKVFSKFNWKFVEDNKYKPYHSDPDHNEIETLMRK